MAHDIILAAAVLRSGIFGSPGPSNLTLASSLRDQDDDMEVVREGGFGGGILRLKGGASVYEQVEQNIANRNVAYQLRFISDQLNYGTLSEDQAQELSARSMAEHLLAPMRPLRFILDALVIALIAAVSGSILGASACVLSTNVVCPEMTQAVTAASVAAALGVNLLWNVGVRLTCYCKGWTRFDDPKFRKKLFITYGFVLFFRFFAPSIVLMFFADLFGAIAPIATFVPINQTELNITGLNGTDVNATVIPPLLNSTEGNFTGSNETTIELPEPLFKTVFEPGFLVFAFEEYWRAWGVLLGSTIAFCCCCCCCGVAIAYKFDIDPDDWFEPFSEPVRERPAWMDKPYPERWDSESRKKLLQERMKELEEEKLEKMKLEKQQEKERKKEEKKAKKQKKAKKAKKAKEEEEEKEAE